jgi:DNA-binding CsgD family transcriptional regulator
MLRSELIYEALLDADALRELPRSLAAAVNARSAILQLSDGNGHNSCFAYTYYDPKQIRDYEAAFAKYDPWAQVGLSSPRNQNRAIIVAELFPDPLYERSVFYNEFIRSHGDDTYRCLGSVLTLSEGFGLIGLQRGKTQPQYNAKERAVLQAAIPHMRRLFSVRSALLRADLDARLAHSALDQLSVIAMAVDREGRIMLNGAETAEPLLRKELGLNCRSGRLQFSNGIQSRWEHLLTQATRGADPCGGAMLIGTRKSNRAPVWLEISPAPALPRPMRAVVVIRLGSGLPEVVRRRLRDVLGLTQAEAEVAYMVSQGACAEAIAAARSVALSTVRAQIRSIFAKLECGSLSTLASMVARLT